MRLEYLIVVLPGFGGSVLVGDDGVAWSGSKADLISRFFSPEVLGIDRPLRATGLLTKPALMPGWSMFLDYGPLAALVSRPFENVVVDAGDPEHPVESANVVLYPYDFRKSVAESAQALDDQIRWRARALFGDREGPRVILVAHSMGGLVARYWMSCLNGWPLCRALLTLGTPHRGAPKALETLVNGPRFPGADRVLSLLRSFPSMYELLPRYKAIWSQAHSQACYPHELASELGLDPAQVRRGFETHRSIETGWNQVPANEEGAPEVYPFVGYGNPTLQSATWDGTSLAASKAAPSWLQAREIDGDGTVPGWSAIPLELEGRVAAVRTSAEMHGPISHSPQVHEVLRALHLAGGAGQYRGQGDVERPVLGLEVEETSFEAASVLVGARLRGGEGANSDAEVWGQFESYDGLAPRAAKFEPDEGNWRLELSGLPVGFWKVTAKAVRGDTTVASNCGVFAVVPEG